MQIYVPRLPGLEITFGESTRHGCHILQHDGATFVFLANLALLLRKGVGFFIA